MALIHVGTQMTKLGAKLMQLGNQQSKPGCHDIAKIMTVSAEMMHVGYQYLQDPDGDDDDADYSPAMVQKQSSPNKRARSDTSDPPPIRRLSNQPIQHRPVKQKRRISLPILPEVVPTHLPHTALSRTSATSAAKLSSSAASCAVDAPDERTHPVYFLPVKDNVGLATWNIFSELFGDVADQDVPDRE